MAESVRIPYRVMAVPYYDDPKTGDRFLIMVTSRTRGRWIFPKGKLDPGRTEEEMIEVECYEEAGVRGKIVKKWEARGVYGDLDGKVDVHLRLLRVKKILEDWPEKQQRRRKLFKPDKAFKQLVPELRELVLPLYQQISD